MRDYHHFLFYSSKIFSDTVELDQDESRHAVKVLRLSQGDNFLVTNGNGISITCSLDNFNKGIVEGKIIEKTAINEIRPGIHFYIGIPDRDPFETIVTDLTAMGVAEITPLITEQCQKNWWEQKWEKHLERLRNKMIAAMKQSLYPRLPVLNVPTDFNLVNNIKRRTFVADIDGQPMHTYKNVFEEEINCLVGPPGGFSLKEVQFFKDHNFDFVKIAPTRLRTELAATVLCAQIIGDSKENQ